MSERLNQENSRDGNVDAETQRWLDANPDNTMLGIAVQNLRKYTDAWRNGMSDSDEALHRAVDLYQLWDDGSVDEITMAVLNQATTWMQFEMDIDYCSDLGLAIEDRIVNGTGRI